MADYPNLERALLDWLPTVTGFAWEAPGRHSIGARVPVGIAERAGGSGGATLDAAMSIEVTVAAATRSGCWAMAQQIDRAFLRSLNPGGAGVIYVDEVRLIFGWAIDPDRSGDGYNVASATYTLTVRPQAAATTTEGS